MEINILFLFETNCFIIILADGELLPLPAKKHKKHKHKKHKKKKSEMETEDKSNVLKMAILSPVVDDNLEICR